MKIIVTIVSLGLVGCSGSFYIGAHPNGGVTVEQVNQALTQVDAALQALNKRVEVLEPKKK